MRTFLKILLGGFVYTGTLMIVMVAIGFWWLSEEFQKPGPLAETALFEISRGEGLFEITDNLRDAGALDDRNKYSFIFGARLLSAQSVLKAGEYELSSHISPRQILDKIRNGEIVERRITIREGLTSYEIVEMLNGIEELTGDIATIPPEGTLLPQTYDYRWNEPRQDILARMQADMAKTMQELWPLRSPGLPFTSETEALTLASIIEKETGIEAERKRIAGVFVNRLRQGIPLQSDPTVIYALINGRPENKGLGPLGRRLLTKDLQFASPYNTYRNAGLPPGPIANPGRASIEAALQPEQNDFLYFVADGSGGHIFSRTLEEHNKNAAHWHMLRREKEKNN